MTGPLTFKDYPTVDQDVMHLRELGRVFLETLSGLRPDQWDEDPSLIAAEQALLAEMTKHPEKALVVCGQVVAVVDGKDEPYLGVWDL